MVLDYQLRSSVPVEWRIYDTVAIAFGIALVLGGLAVLIGILKEKRWAAYTHIILSALVILATVQTLVLALAHVRFLGVTVAYFSWGLIAYLSIALLTVYCVIRLLKK